MRRLTLISLLLVGPWEGAAVGQVITEMTPALIEEAIRSGTAGGPGLYRLEMKAGPTIGFFSTPFSRVAAAALDAKRKYRTFTAADVTSDLIAPELLVYAHSFLLDLPDGGQKLLNVVAIAVLPKRSKGVSPAIHPLRTSEIPATYQNLFGARWQGMGIMAAFPIRALTDGDEVHIVFDKHLELDMRPSCTDCSAIIRLKGVR